MKAAILDSPVPAPASRRPRVSAVRVAICAGYPVVRSGVRSMLDQGEGDFVVIGEAASTGELLALVARERPDVVVLDVWMPDGDGIQTLRALLSHHRDARVLMLSSEDAQGYRLSALRGGACGLLMKVADAAEVRAALVDIANGKSLFGEKVEAHALHDLTQRELDVLRLMARGLNNAKIAEALFLSGNTVKTHVSNIFAKLGCNDRASAVLVAWKQRLI